MRLLVKGDWIEVRSVHDVEGVPGSLDGYIKSNGGPARTTGGYVAAVLEAAKVVDVDLNRPARTSATTDDCHRAVAVSRRKAQPSRSHASTVRSRVRSQLFPGLI